jgi:hypothetical protein
MERVMLQDRNPPLRVDDAQVDWRCLDRLREIFLRASAGPDYWRSEADLASYDRTFAQRIGWKWDFVLRDLHLQGWSPPGGALLDWGCGSGVATRAFLDHFGASAVSRVHFSDRSALAMRYASGRARQKYPGLPVTVGSCPSPDVVLLSHVLTELRPVEIEELTSLLEKATVVVWVEPGTHQASRALIEMRERLRPHLRPIAPCLHAASCGLLAMGHERHWCHHFAPPPPEVFNDPFWGRFAARMEIDLRSVPLSYLVLDRRSAPPRPAGLLRLLGRPRVAKAHLHVFACEASGVGEYVLSRREFPEEWKAARKQRMGSVVRDSWGAKEG